MDYCIIVNSLARGLCRDESCKAACLKADIYLHVMLTVAYF
jgi:hypothetical protein